MKIHTSIDEIMALTLPELRKFGTSDLRELLVKLDSAANKRMSRMKKAGRISMAMSMRMASVKEGADYRFTAPKGLTKSQIISRIGKVSQYLNLKTSSLKGARETAERISEKITGNKKSFYDLPEKQQAKFWMMYRKLESRNLAAAREVGSDKIQRMLYNLRYEQKKSAKDAFDETYAYMEREYRKMTREAARAVDDEFYEV